MNQSKPLLSIIRGDPGKGEKLIEIKSASKKKMPSGLDPFPRNKNKARRNQLRN